MLEILVRPLAEGDIKNVWRYSFETWGERQADTYIDDMQETMKNIAQNPEIGIQIDQIRQGYRQYHYEHHLILYKPTPSAIEVVRILHERMDVESYIL